MLSAPVQADIPTRMWVYPAVSSTPLDPVYTFAQVPSTANATNTVPANPQRLVDAWITQVLRAR